MHNKRMDSESLAHLKSELVRTWQIGPTQSQGELVEAAQLLGALKERIVDLLGHDMQTLVTAMYRLDISERKFEQAMSLSGFDRIAEALARTVLERELQRIRSRQSYEQQQPKPLDE